LVRVGVDQEVAAGLMANVYVGISVGAPLMAYIARVTNRPREIVGVATVMVFSSFLGMLLGGHHSLVLLYTGLWAGAEMLCFSLAVQAAPASQSGTTTAIINSAVMGTAALLQFGVGWGLDKFFLVSPDAEGLAR
jgi:hypothetical protein